MSTYIWLILTVNVGRYTSPTDGMGNKCNKKSLHMDNLHILFFQDSTWDFSDVQHMGYTGYGSVFCVWHLNLDDTMQSLKALWVTVVGYNPYLNGVLSLLATGDEARHEFRSLKSLESYHADG